MLVTGWFWIFFFLRITGWCWCPCPWWGNGLGAPRPRAQTGMDQVEPGPLRQRHWDRNFWAGWAGPSRTQSTSTFWAQKFHLLENKTLRNLTWTVSSHSNRRIGRTHWRRRRCSRRGGEEDHGADVPGDAEDADAAVRFKLALVPDDCGQSSRRGIAA